MKKVRKIYQKIEEQSLEVDHEFLSVEAMEKLGWSEQLVASMVPSW